MNEEESQLLVLFVSKILSLAPKSLVLYASLLIAKCKVRLSCVVLLELNEILIHSKFHGYVVQAMRFIRQLRWPTNVILQLKLEEVLGNQKKVRIMILDSCPHAESLGFD